MGLGYCDLLIRDMKWFSYYAFIHQIPLEMNKIDIDPASVLDSQ